MKNLIYVVVVCLVFVSEESVYTQTSKSDDKKTDMVNVCLKSGTKKVPRHSNITIESSSGDEISGELLDCSSEQIVVRSSFGEVAIPIQNVKDVAFSTTINTKGKAQQWPTDPNSRRALFLPTTETLRKGDKMYENYYLFVHNFYYGVSDQVTINAGLTAIPTDGDFIDNQVYGLGIKARFYETPKIRFAAGAQFVKMPWSESEDVNKFAYTYGVLGIGDPSDAQLNLSMGYILGISSSEKPFIYSGNVSKRLSRNFSLIGEVMWVGTQQDPDYSTVFYSYGIRFMTRRLGVDLGFFNVSEEGYFPGIPMVNFNYSWR
ncbi:MAG TPA: hypothetical protein PKU71_13900 [bacterium]|nr:hypothetical protein [bacterium]HNH30502.1 hypothetical protein [bacterium]